MANKIQIKRGLKSKLPILLDGELGLCTDTNELFIGNSGGNIDVTNKSEINIKQNKTDNSLTTTSKTVIGAINENKTNITTTSNKIGNTLTAKTNAKDNVVNMVNELYNNKANIIDLNAKTANVTLGSNVILQTDASNGNKPIFSLNKTFDGIIMMNASFQHSSKTDKLTTTTVLCTLPVGYRPVSQLMFPCIVARGVFPDVENQILNVYPDGRVMLILRSRTSDVVTPPPCEVVRVSFFF